MPSIPLMRDGNIRTVLQQHNARGPALDEAGARAITQAAGEGGAVSSVARGDVEALLNSAEMAPAARKVLQDFLATPRTHLPSAGVQQGTRNSPAFAFFAGRAQQDGCATQGTGGVQGPDVTVTPGPPPTLRPPAVIASTQQHSPNALVQLWAIPGSTVRVYNNSVLENGRPKLLKEITAPHTNDGEGVRCLDFAYPTQREFKEDAKVFNAAPHDGMVLVSVPMGADDDQDARDTLAVTMQTSGRPESEWVYTRMHTYGGPVRRDRMPQLDLSRTTLDNGVLTTQGEYAMTPGKSVSVMKDGLQTNVHATADEKGRLRLDLTTLGDLSNVTLMVRSDAGSEMALDASVHGLAAAMPTVKDRMARLDAAIMKGLSQAPVNGRLRFEVPEAMEGMALEIRNANNPAQVHTFVASGGKLVVDLDNVWPGDGLSVKLDPSRVPAWCGGAAQPARGEAHGNTPALISLEGRDGRDHFMFETTMMVGDEAQAARRQHVLNAFAGHRVRELHLALDLFGPGSRIQGGTDVSDPQSMRDIFQGALLGSSISGRWEDRVRDHVKAHGSAALLQGLELGISWGDTVYQSLARDMFQAGFVRSEPPAPGVVCWPDGTRRDVEMLDLALPGLPVLKHLKTYYGSEGVFSGPHQDPKAWRRSMENPRASGFVFALQPA